MATINLGFDFGNSDTKISDMANRYYFQSGYTVRQTSSGDEDEMEFCGRFYQFNRSLEPEDDKTASDRMMACTLFALARLMEARNEDPEQIHLINFCVDVPINTAQAVREAYKDYYAGQTKSCVFHGRTWTFSFGVVLVVEQGKCIYMSGLRDYTQYDTVQLLDIGGGTVDGCVIEYDGREIRITNTFSLSAGVRHLMRAVQADMRALNIKISDMMLGRAIINGTIAHKRRTDIMKSIDFQMEYYLQNLKADILNNGFDAGFPTLLGGGGSDLFPEAMRESFNVIASKGRFANADSCCVIIQQYMKKLEKKNGKRTM